MTLDKTLPLPAQKIIIELLADGCRGDPLDVRYYGNNINKRYRIVTFPTLDYKARPNAEQDRDDNGEDDDDDDEYDLSDSDDEGDDEYDFSDSEDEVFVDSRGEFDMDSLNLENLKKCDYYTQVTTEFRWNPYALLELAMVNKLFYAGLMSDSAWARFNVYNVENVAQHFIASRKSRQPDTSLYDELYEMRANQFTCEFDGFGCCSDCPDYPGSSAAWKSKRFVSLLLKWDSSELHAAIGDQFEPWTETAVEHFAALDGRILRHRRLWVDYWTVKNAISSWGKAIQWANNYKDNKEFQLLAVGQDPSAVQFFKPDRDVMIAALTAPLRTPVCRLDCCADLCTYDGHEYLQPPSAFFSEGYTKSQMSIMYKAKYKRKSPLYWHREWIKDEEILALAFRQHPEALEFLEWERLA